MKAVILTSGSLIAAQILSAWLRAGHSVAALWIGSKDTDHARFLRRDRALGLLAPSWSIGALVRRYGLPIAPSPNLTSPEADAEIARLGADMLITAITRHIVPERILARFPGRAVNFHPALLPHYRGPNPRSGMLLDGTAGTYGGITLHCLSRGIDKGDIIGIREVRYDAGRGFVDWDVCIARAAGELVRNELQDYLGGHLRARAQAPEAGSYRKVGHDERTLSETLSASRAKLLCDRLAGSDWLRFRAPGEHSRKYAVSRFIGTRGSRTFAKPRIGRYRIEFDAADARVAVGRRRGRTPLPRLMRYWLAIARHSR